MKEQEPSAAPPLWFSISLSLCALAFVLAAFAPALEGKFLQWDDAQGVAANEELRRGPAHAFAWGAWGAGATHMGHFQPLAWATLAIDVAGEPVDAATGMLGDAAAARCHRTNLWLHALGAVAVGLLAERLLRAAARREAAAGRATSPHVIAAAALAASLVWALHPLRVESVAWITERRDVLATIPLVLSAYLYVLWSERRPLGALFERGLGFYVAALALLCVSLFAKAWGIVLPAVLVVLDFHPLGRAGLGPRALWRSVLEKLPFFALAAVFAWIAARAQSSLPDAMPPFSEHTWLERSLQACFGLVWYVGKFVVPTDLVALVELPREISIRDPRFLAPALAVPLVAAGLWLLRRRLPGLAAAAIVSTLCVAPVLGFAQAGPQLVADRYAHLHGIALAVLLGGALIELASRVKHVPWLLAAVLVVTLGLQTRAQSATWRDTESLWTNVLARDPDNVVANLSLGNERARRAFLASDPREIAERLAETERLFAHGLAVSDDPRFATRLAMLHDALAKLEPDRAEEHARLAAEYSEQAVALAIATGRVRPETRFARALRLLELGRVDEALAELEWYAGARPDDPRGREALESARARKAAGGR